jgi:hypothetical protein
MNKVYRSNRSHALSHKPHLGPIQTTARKRQPFPPGPTISALQALKLLHQPHRHIARLRQRVLLSEANPRPTCISHQQIDLKTRKAHKLEALTVEGQVFPPGSQRLPALRLVQVRVLAVQVFASVHRVW